MDKLTFQNDYKIRYSELDCNLTLKPAALLQLLQDIASENAESLGFGYSFISKKKLAWFLLKLHIEFYKYPQGDISIKTEPRGYNRLFAFRDFEIITEDSVLGNATTTWGLIDLNTKSMANISEVLAQNPKMKPFEKREDDLKYNKISTLQRIDAERIFEIRFDDLDVNQHVNNSNFLIWALEVLDFEFRKSKKLKTLDIIFKKEIKYGAKVASQVQIEQNTTIHCLKNAESNEELCLIQAEWI